MQRGPQPVKEESATRPFYVGDCLVQPVLNQVARGDAVVRIEPKAMEVLLCLAARPGEVVSKDELYAAVWPDTFVTDHVLTHVIWQLRQILPDRNFVQTISKRGYRLAAPVRPATDRAITERAGSQTDLGAHGASGTGRPDEDGRRGSEDRSVPVSGAHHLLRARLTAGILAGLALAAAGYLLYGRAGNSLLWPGRIESIVVLPFENLSGDSEQEYFADAVTGELISEFQRIAAFKKVIARASSIYYKGTKKPLREIGRELEVDAVLEGTVQRSGNRVRITAELSHAATDRQLWSGKFESDWKDALSLQDELAQAIIREVGIKLAPEERARLGRSRSPVPEANAAYQKGRHFFEKGEMAKAADYFEEAAAKDPKFALAYAFLAEADANATTAKGLSPTPRAWAAIATAIQLDSNSAEAHTLAGDVKFYLQWRWTEGEAEFRRAVELDPGSDFALFHYALCLRTMGRYQAAMRELERVHELDPLSPRTNRNLARWLLDDGQHDRALEQCQRIIELDPASPMGYDCLGAVYERQGRDQEAVALYLKALSVAGQAERAKSLQAAFATGGIRAYYKNRLDEALNDAARRGERLGAMQAAILSLRAGEKEQALQWLEEGYRNHATNFAWLKAYAERGQLRALWSDPRLQDILRRMNFPQ